MRPPRIELLHVTGCPLVDQVRASIDGCLRDAGITAEVEEREGAFASPTLLVDGVDVVTGGSARTRACCRLDLPTRAQILTALGASAL